MFYRLFFVLFLIGRLNRNRNFSLKIIGIGIGTQKSISVGPYGQPCVLTDTPIGLKPALDIPKTSFRYGYHNPHYP